MLLPTALYSRLAGAPGAAEPLPVERNPAAGAAPFLFTPRLVRFPRDHEFFEVRENPEHPYRAGLRGRTVAVGGARLGGAFRMGGTCGQSWGLDVYLCRLGQVQNCRAGLRD